mmetsp:Transcript_15892/g.48058  ORF Transcript_15892/g.48058 Transcript_15892/m.48058 type:complete len:101 (-) Transcript_15892:1033-1335(-)
MTAVHDSSLSLLAAGRTNARQGSTFAATEEEGHRRKAASEKKTRGKRSGRRSNERQCTIVAVMTPEENGKEKEPRRRSCPMNAKGKKDNRRRKTEFEAKN